VRDLRRMLRVSRFDAGQIEMSVAGCWMRIHR
jgi:hypothetical protein